MGTTGKGNNKMETKVQYLTYYLDEFLEILITGLRIRSRAYNTFIGLPVWFVFKTRRTIRFL